MLCVVLVTMATPQYHGSPDEGYSGDCPWSQSKPAFTPRPARVLVNSVACERSTQNPIGFPRPRPRPLFQVRLTLVRVCSPSKPTKRGSFAAGFAEWRILKPRKGAPGITTSPARFPLPRSVQ
ncbi:hypothetical protein KOW79_020059 [Hemibagrus wyckioides]|uniref:Uncharacterized protein n=1 Tax=Hemibagrus wyckioides TaxID=337641 RepID=A0A9D3SE74_9TELE|nr:hypothetical protein KOW79_020059 [Hemibagrus wyckioides]